MKYWLTEDIIGYVSRVKYGEQGEQVECIREDGTMFLVKGKQVFHVKKEFLSDKPLITDEQKEEASNQEQVPEIAVPCKASKPGKKKSAPKQKTELSGPTLF